MPPLLPSSSPSSLPSVPSRRSLARLARGMALACPLVVPVFVAAQGAPRARVLAALDPAPASLAWPVGAVAAAGLASAASAPSAAPPSRWEVRTQDITLSRTLERWAAQAGYRLKWDAARNFLIGAADVYQGGFEDALRAVLGSAGIRGSDYPLEACIYANTPPLVRITRLGEQARECHAS